MSKPTKPAQERVGLLDGIHAYGVIDGAWRAAGEPREVPVTGGRLEFVPTVCGLEIVDPGSFIQRLRELTGANAEVGNEDCLREVQRVRELAQHFYPVAGSPGGRPPPLATHLEWAVDAARKAERALTIQMATELYASMAQTRKPAKKRGKR